MYSLGENLIYVTMRTLTDFLYWELRRLLFPFENDELLCKRSYIRKNTVCYFDTNSSKIKKFVYFMLQRIEGPKKMPI